jgi:hypothetical protein
VERQYVAIDLHLHRSHIVRENEAGEQVGVVRIDNDPAAFSAALAEAGPDPEVAIEATYGWYWVVDQLQAEGADVHLVNPSGLYWEDRRVKNDYRDCCDLLDRLRLDKLGEAWIAPPVVRELRELVRYRAKLVALRTGLKAQLKAVLAKHGARPTSTMGTDESEPLNRAVARGRAAVEDGVTDGIAYSEWSAADHADPDDPTTWRRCMPALGYTITEAVVVHARGTLTDGEFRRAFLNQMTRADQRVLPVVAWQAVCSDDAAPTGMPTFAIDVNPERSAGAIVAASA